MTIRIKICGITGRDDAKAAHECGADYIGIIVDVSGSRRSVSLQQAVEICSGIPSAILLMEKPIKAIETVLRSMTPHAVQLIGPMAPEDIARLRAITDIKLWKTVHVPRNHQGEPAAIAQRIAMLHQAGIDMIVLDTLVPGRKGGTGQICDWNTAASIVQCTELPVFLAGGLTPDNVAQAVADVRPWGVDVSSGVELSPGKKDIEKVSRFIRHAATA